MLSRINPFIVIRYHWRSLEIREPKRRYPDKAARAILLAIPSVVGLGFWWLDLHLQQADVLVGALSLFAAGLLAAFAQLAAIRARYPKPDTDWDPHRLTREMLDEGVAHVLTAVLLSASTAVLIIVGMSVGQDADGALNSLFSIPVAVVGSYLFLTFIMTIRKLFGAYVLANDVELRRVD